MRLKSVPRKVNQRRSYEYLLSKDGDGFSGIPNIRYGISLDLMNSTGLDLSVKKKIQQDKTRDLQRRFRRVDSSSTPDNLSTSEYPLDNETFQVQNNLHEIIQQNRVKDTFLYRIMTDSKFMERVQRHNKSMKPSCQFCKMEFESEVDLRNHSKIQMDDMKRVSCCACGKTFAQKRYLRYHQRCHSDRSKFVCDICLKKYSRLDNLTRHNIFHTNPDKFPCTMCDRAFARKDLLNKHQKSHENKYKWYCNHCQKYFKGPVTLENHMRIFHTPQTNFNEPAYDISNEATCSFGYA